MSRKKTIKKIILPAIIVLFTMAVVAQITTGKNLFNGIFSKKPVTAETEKLIEEPEDSRKITDDDPWQEMEKVFRQFNEGKNISYSGKIRLQEEDDDKILEEIPYSCEVNEADYHYSIDSVEMIYSHGISINVFHREKLIILGKEKQKIKNWWSFSSIDSVKKYALLDSAEVKVMQDGALKLISVENTGNPDIYAYEIYYDPVTYRLKKLIMFFASLENLLDDGDAISDDTGKDNAQKSAEEEEPANANGIYFNTYRMELTYDNFSSHEAEKNFSPESKYIRINKKKVMINEAYKNYRIVVPGAEQTD
jgi:hypothetical protein